jgi:hypothetical protein
MQGTRLATTQFIPVSLRSERLSEWLLTAMGHLPRVSHELAGGVIVPFTALFIFRPAASYRPVSQFW